MKMIFRLLFVPFYLSSITRPLHAQWTQVCGSYGGQTPCVTVNGTTLIAGTANGIFCSTDDGTNWTATKSGITSSVTLFTMNSTGIFAGTKNAGVLRSTNNGVDWSAVNTGLTNTSVTALTIDSTNLIAGTIGGVFLSTNNGANWTFVADTTLKSIRAFLVTTKNTGGKGLFAASDAGIFCSTDHGMNWTRIVQGGVIYDPVTDGFIIRHFFSLAANDSSLFAGGQPEIYRSTDNGKSWTSVYKLPIQLSNPFYCLAVNKSSIFASTGVDVFCSINNGADWTAVSNGLPKNAYGTQTIYSLTINGSTLFAGTIAGVFRSSDNGMHWYPLNNGLNASSSYSLAASGSNIFASLGSGYCLCRSTDNGSTWTVLNDTVYYHFRSLAANGSYVIAGIDGPIMTSGISSALRSFDNGSSWMTLSNSPAPFTAHSYGINNNYSFCGFPYANIGVYRCHRDSSTWIGMNNGLPPGVSTLITSGSKVYVGTLQSGIYYSPDNGANWIAMQNGIETATTLFNSIAVDGSTIFAGTSKNDNLTSSMVTPKGMYRSTDYGASWATANNGLPIKNITDVVVSGSVVLSSTDSTGVFLSRNNGGSWLPFNDGLPNPYISSLAVNESYAYVGLLGGIWRRPLAELVSVDKQDSFLPKQYFLEQNYPNPFNPSTAISFSLPSQSFVSLKVFDALGREAATVISEELSAGSYTRHWNAVNMASGVYFYQLRAGTYTETKKLILLR